MNSARPPSHHQQQQQPMPQLVLIKQTNQGEEKFTKNGIIQNAHVVIKNTPFVLQLGLLNNVLFNHIFNFNQFTLEAKLIYDTDAEKEVDFVRVKPLEFKTHLSERGEQCTMEARIKVLSSQHEDLFFRMKIIALDARTGQEFSPSLFVLSQPIKVISKPEKVIKSNSQKKRNFTEMLLETVQKLEKQQKEQQAQISKLFEGLQKAPQGVPLKKEEAPAQVIPPKESKKIEESSSQEFDQVFKRMVDSYSTLVPEERSTKIRKAVRSLNPSDLESLSQMIDLVRTDGFQREPFEFVNDPELGEHSQQTCTCSNCHYKEELLRIDDFYKDFLGTL